MPVTGSELRIYQSINTPSDSVSLVGGSISAVQITGNSIGEVFTASIDQAYILGGGDNVRFQKIFYKNTDPSDALNGALLWLPNTLLDVASPGRMTVVSSSPNDNNNFQIYCIGLDNTGTPQVETLPLNGQTPVQGVINWAYPQRVVFQNASTKGLIASQGTITISVNGQVIGIIPGPTSQYPTGWYSATSEISIGLAPSQNDSATTNNTLTTPSGIVFSKPNSFQTALAIPGTNIAAGSAIGIWVRLIVKAGLAPSADIQVLCELYGTPA